MLRRPTVPLFLLDTDHVSLHQRGDTRITAAVLAKSPDEVGLTIVTAEEQLRGRLAQVRQARTGAERVRTYAYLHTTLGYLSSIRIYDFDAPAEQHYQA